MNVLHICANPKPAEESVCKQLSIAFISTLIEKNPDIEVSNVDLYQEPPPFLSYAAFRGIWNPAFDPSYKPTREEQKAVDYADKQAAIFNEADVLVLTMPMWNFSVPAIMKAWIDQIMAPNRTFVLETDEEGRLRTRPLHHIRKLVLLASSGGAYNEGDPRDALLPEIRSAFGFIGITDFTVAWADGQNPMAFGDHEERKQTAVDAAVEAAEDIADMLASAAPAPAAQA